MFWLPEFDGSPHHWLLIALLVSSPMLFWGEASGNSRFGYSKFASREGRRTLPSRLGMLLIYFPAVFTYWIPLRVLGVEATGWHLLVGGLLSLHFLKRVLEVLFVHRYSGVTHLSSALAISAIYAFEAGLLGYVAAVDVDAARLASADFDPWLRSGLALWGLGTAGNAYHHWLLARLRRGDELGYRLPRGGLFAWVACPHYLFELIAWWGLALVFHHVAGAIVVVLMTSYLAGRADATLRWYRDRLPEELPTKWRRLVPRIY